ncbi:hypothetical protein QYF61_014611 [Mycteria americana]|uniref:Uncharacterized protein n=1 Tax=Mycteria americana TaxID=33587 RepID=A0AAN7PI88_MYCAM|nr:hypothetical protein QYF61_014611 [Mycteria americana]
MSPPHLGRSAEDSMAPSTRAGEHSGETGSLSAYRTTQRLSAKFTKGIQLPLHHHLSPADQGSSAKTRLDPQLIWMNTASVRARTVPTKEDEDFSSDSEDKISAPIHTSKVLKFSKAAQPLWATLLAYLHGETPPYSHINLLYQLMPIASHPPAMHHGEEPGSVFSLAEMYFRYVAPHCNSVEKDTTTKARKKDLKERAKTTWRKVSDCPSSAALMTGASRATGVTIRTMKSGEVPGDWKKGNIATIFKKGRKEDPRNYQPVSCTSVPGKIME